ncbi:hypothetical protein, partial [Actinomycetospora atypica]
MTAAGNTGAGSVTISYTAPAIEPVIAATSGDGQSARVGRPFAEPLVATVTDRKDTRSVAGASVTFAVASGSATFSGSATVVTDGYGRATSPMLIAGAGPGPVVITASIGGQVATFSEAVIAAAPVAPAATVKGGGTLTAGGRTYSIAVDAKAAAAGQASGRFALLGGGSDTTARSINITSVRKTPGGSTVTGTAITASGKKVAFTVTAVDKAAGRDQVVIQVGSKTVTGT